MDWIYCSVSPGVGWLYYKDASNPTIGTCVPPIVPVSITFTFTHLVAKCLFFFSRGRIFESHPLFDHDCASLSCLVFASLGIGPELGIIGLGLSKSKPDNRENTGCDSSAPQTLQVHGVVRCSVRTYHIDPNFVQGLKLGRKRVLTF